jgi:arsenate reductase
MAEAFFNHLTPRNLIASSAGTSPVEQVNPIVVTVMREAGLDISQQKPKMLTHKMLEEASMVITMGCSKTNVCPNISTYAENWGVLDPSGKSLSEVRRIRDQIKSKVIKLIDEITKRPKDFTQI